MEYCINTYHLKNYVDELKAGDHVLLSGIVYTARDAAHKRMCEAVDNNNSLPFQIKEAVIYYAGPTPAPAGLAVGSCGPTTSSRMDIFTPKLLNLGLRGIIGKGERNEDVVKSIVKNKAVYFCAIGGAGALASKCIKECEIIAYKDLGCEAIRKLVIEDFPAIVAVDTEGNNIFRRN